MSQEDPKNQAPKNEAPKKKRGLWGWLTGGSSDEAAPSAAPAEPELVEAPEPLPVEAELSLPEPVVDVPEGLVPMEGAAAANTPTPPEALVEPVPCLLYTSDAADE